MASARLWFCTGALELSRMLRIPEPSFVVNGFCLARFWTIIWKYEYDTLYRLHSLDYRGDGRHRGGTRAPARSVCADFDPGGTPHRPVAIARTRTPAR